MIQQYSKPNFIIGDLSCFRGTLIQNLLGLIRCVLKTKGEIQLSASVAAEGGKNQIWCNYMYYYLFDWSDCVKG